MILLKHQLLESEMCEELMNAPRTFKPGQSTVGGQYNSDYDFRMTLIAPVNDDVFDEFFYTYTQQYLMPHFGIESDDVVIRLQYARYYPGYYLKKHSDQPPGRNKTHPRKRVISASICLRDDYDGGELVLYEGNASIKTKLKAGEMIAFPSDTQHEVLPIKEGTRDVIVAWITIPSEEYEATNLE
jgi:predicted 2-oxoglutarate/Fe(II)-dependent dioxygenase YbiX